MKYKFDFVSILNVYILMIIIILERIICIINEFIYKFYKELNVENI